MSMIRLVVNGAQVVTVENRWAYLWPYSPRLEIGDDVILPVPDDHRLPGESGEWRGRVTGHGSGWDGKYKFVIRRAP